MEFLQSFLTNNLWSVALVCIGAVILYTLWKNRNSVKEAVYDIIGKMPRGGSQQDRTPKPVLQRVAGSTHKSDGQEGPHTE